MDEHHPMAFSENNRYSTSEFASQPDLSRRSSSPDRPRLDDYQLEQQITSLCAVMAATEYQFLSLLAEFDQRGGWAGEGTRSCAHWLNWRCGINLGAAREKVRVANALTDLPKISEAFSKGHLSYSKVRAMTRIATPELEDDLMVTAQYGSASHVEKLVRLYRRCETREELEAERDACNQRHYTRKLSHFWDEDGSLVIKASIPPEQGALIIKALEAATEALKEDDQFDPLPNTQSLEPDKCVKDVSAETPPDTATVKTSTERQVARRADALVLIARDWLNQDHSASKSADRYQVVVNVDADVLANKIRPGPSEQACSIDEL